MTARFIATLLFSLLACTTPHAADWPQYRGPNAAGQIAGPAAPTTWNVATGENIRWRMPIPGLGHASPIVWVTACSWPQR